MSFTKMDVDTSAQRDTMPLLLREARWFLNVLQFHHWNTTVYSDHIRLDRCIELVRPHIDILTEVFRGYNFGNTIDMAHEKTVKEVPIETIGNTLQPHIDLMLKASERVVTQARIPVENFISDLNLVKYLLQFK